MLKKARTAKPQKTKRTKRTLEMCPKGRHYCETFGQRERCLACSILKGEPIVFNIPHLFPSYFSITMRPTSLVGLLNISFPWQIQDHTEFMVLALQQYHVYRKCILSFSR
jgi:hypothetical protein